MTDKQRLFVDAYLNEARGNATQAARIAGFEHPNKDGWRARNHPEVKKEIDRRLAENTMSANEVLYRLRIIASASMADAFEEQDVGRRRFPALNFQTLFETGLIHAVKSIKSDMDGTEIKLHDSIAALKLLMQYHGLLKPQEKEQDEDALALLRQALGIAPPVSPSPAHTPNHGNATNADIPPGDGEAAMGMGTP